MEVTLLEVSELAKKAVGAAADKQARDILLLDIRRVSDIADYFIICSADSERQIQAVCDEIDKALKQGGLNWRRHAGDPSSGWMILDYSQIIVHVLAPRQREYYNLEDLWSKATPVVRIL